MDDRKQRIMMAIVSLYGAEGEPVGSNLLSRHFDMAVSSATLRNEMAALTRLGLLEQPHTSAGRVPTSKGYRYYVENLLEKSVRLAPAEKQKLDTAFRALDYDPDRMVQGAAKALAENLGHAVLATTPRAQDITIAHFEILQVGRHTAAVLGVTSTGGVRTRVAKVDFELSACDAAAVAAELNRQLCFVAGADVDSARIRTLVDSVGAKGPRCWPMISAALTLLSEAGRPKIYFEGQKNLLKWPEMEYSLRSMVELMDDPEQVERLLKPEADHTTIMFGEEIPDHPVEGLCLVSRRYLAGGGLAGVISVAGPTRMRYREVIPKLEYFSNLLGQGLTGSMAG